jgi:hypothetical protein
LSRGLFWVGFFDLQFGTVCTQIDLFCAQRKYAIIGCMRRRFYDEQTVCKAYFSNLFCVWSFDWLTVSESEDPLYRFKLVMAFALAGLHRTVTMYKPFNPILGTSPYHFNLHLYSGADLFDLLSRGRRNVSGTLCGSNEHLCRANQASSAHFALSGAERRVRTVWLDLV